MKAKLTKFFIEKGFSREPAEIMANEVMDIIIKWLTDKDVDRKTVNRNHICDVLPELHAQKLIDFFDEEEPF